MFCTLKSRRRVSMSTEFPSKNGIVRQWHVIDAQELILGKLASKAAMLLMGKTKPSYTPFLDTGDHVIVINAEKVRVTGRKETDKMYRHFTGYPGGLVETSFKRVRAEKPVRLVEDAIFGMIREIKVNNLAFENDFPTESAPAMVRQPLAATETMEKFDLLILADGGGIAGQAGAARLGISRALVGVNAELRSRLKKLDRK